LAAQAALPGVPAPGPEMDILHLFWGSGWSCGVVLFTLVGFSVGCWGIAIARAASSDGPRSSRARFVDIFWEAKNLSTIQTASTT